VLSQLKCHGPLADIEGAFITLGIPKRTIFFSPPENAGWRPVTRRFLFPLCLYTLFTSAFWRTILSSLSLLDPVTKSRCISPGSIQTYEWNLLKNVQAMQLNLVELTRVVE
jgi:hypothetical protein